MLKNVWKYWTILLFFISYNAVAQDTTTIHTLLQEAQKNAASDLDKSIRLSYQAIEESKKISYTLGVFKANLILANAFYYKHRYLESLQLFLKICKEAEKKSYSKDLAEAYYFISKIHRHQDNIQLSLEYANKTYQIGFQLNNLKIMSKALSAISNIYGKLKNADSSFHYLNQELKILNQLQDTVSVATVYGNIGATYLDLKKIDSAEKYINKAITVLNYRTDIIQQSRNARKFKGGMLYELSSIAYLKKDYKKAEKLALESYDLLLKDNATREISKLSKLFSQIYGAIGDYAKSAAFMDLYASTKDSLIKEENSAKFAEMETLYETQKKEEQLKAQTVLLGQERRTNQLYITVFSLVLLSLLLLMLFIRNRQQYRTQILLQQEKENSLNKVLETEEKERSRIAKDLHDGIVQDLTVIKLKIQSVENTPDAAIKNELKTIYTEVEKVSKELREISYQMMPVTLKELGLVAALEDLLNRLLPMQQIQFDFEAIGIENRLPEKIEVSVYRICQELLNNSIKHSQASAISLLLLLKNNILTLTYEDNGVGFDVKNASKGIGLNSLDSRIKMIQGSLELNSSQNEGTTAYIKIPV